MPRYKRTADEAQLDLPITPQVAPEDVETLQKLRSMWEFASLMQYIFLFGHIVKVDDDLDIEDLEAECLKPEPSPKLARIGLQLLKYVSSHRGLTPDIFDEYARRQYVAKAPHRNPYGEDEAPTPFSQLDVFTRVRVLQQLSTWTLGNVERIRSMMPQDEDHLNWRIEPLGWDKNDSAYYVLDDNRLYRRSDTLARPFTPPPAPKPKSKSKAKKPSKSKPTRSSKRRKVEEEEEELEELDVDAGAGAQADTTMVDADQTGLDANEESGYGFTDKTWSLVAITLDEYDEFLSTIFRSRDPNEKQLHKRITDDVRPIIEKREEALRQKQLKKLRELENIQKVATAKRSSRLAGKAEKEKEERDKREAEEKHDRDLKMAHEEEERQQRIEEGHDSRRMTREQRVKEREVKRILHEEELKKLEEAADRAASASQEPTTETADAEGDRKRASARQAQTQKEQHKKELAQLAAEENGEGNKWYFDCAVCGMHGENLDDGSHSLACDKCGVWQHSQCHGFTPKQAEGKGFAFICKSCKRQEAEKDKPKIPPLKLGKKGGSASPQIAKTESNGAGASKPSPAMAGAHAVPSKDSGLPAHVQRQLDGAHVPNNQPRPSPGPFGQLINGPSLSPHGQTRGPPGYRYPPVGNFAPTGHAPQQPWQGSPFPPPARPSSSGYAVSPPQHMQNGSRPPSGYASSPPPNQQYAPNGYGPQQPPHQQQHQYVHQQAVASAGGHPGYAPPPPQYQHQQHSNGYGPHGSPAGGHYQMPQQPSYAPPQHQGQQQYYQQAPQMQHQRQPSGNGHPQQHYAPPPQSPMNGFQSPVKSHAQASHSPNPPSSAYQQQYAPQSSPALQPTPSMQGRPAPNLIVTPQPQNQGHQRPPSSNGIAADGMSGPWPAGSKAIPQKHDQPPSSSPMHGEGKAMPAPGLAPSPQVQRTDPASGQAPQVIPVKKAAPEVANGAPAPLLGDRPVESVEGRQ